MACYDLNVLLLHERELLFENGSQPCQNSDRS